MNNDKLNGFEELADGMAPMPAALELDAEKYMSELEEFDLTEAQKHAFLETLWSIMRSFVELGFRADDCGQILSLAALPSTDPEDSVKWDHTPSTLETPNSKE